MMYGVGQFQTPPDESSLSAYDDASSIELNNAGSERETGTSSSSGRVSAVDTNPGYCSNWAFLKVRGIMRSRELVCAVPTHKMASKGVQEFNFDFSC